jgi:hypothetical protein
MQNNEKPIVFLSHSSLDKEPLFALKQILDERAAGSLNFFLSSDGESIKFGRNWVVRVSDALSQAKLMFVFLSPHSADSKWIHFEAGSASANKDIRVVPVCLPGIDLNRITPPLSLLQGFNLHSFQAMENLARICNETFQMKINETFSSSDFENVVKSIKGQGAGFFGDQTWAIDAIEIFADTGSLPDINYNPIPSFDEICKKAGMNCFITTREDKGLPMQVSFEQPGCLIEFNHIEDQKESSERRRIARMRDEPAGLPKPIGFRLHCVLSPELYHINAPLLDQWLISACSKASITVTARLRKGIDLEQARHRLTTKLFQQGISIVGLGEKAGFEFEGFKFSLKGASGGVVWIIFTLREKLDDTRLSKIVEKLFKSEAVWQHEATLSELI